jgi:hypothetical protein
MHPKDWKKFLEKGHGKEIAIAQLSQEMAGHLEASSRDVIVHHDYVLKAIEKHGMVVEQFPMIFETVDFGKALADKPKHITFLHYDKTEWNSWFQVTVKRATETRKIYVCTFYKQKEKEVRRKLKKYPLLR